MYTKPMRANLHALLLPALLALAPDGHAQSGVAAAMSGSPVNKVVINGRRVFGNDPAIIDAARSPILNGKSASSCGFMEPYRSGYDEVYQEYMRSFYSSPGMSTGSPTRSIYAPMGDVSNMASTRGGFMGGQAGADARSGCGDAAWRFAAGRLHILARDKSLAQGFAAFNHEDFATALDLFKTAWNKIGYPEAALMLAQMNLYGIGKAKDPAKAIYWYDRLAGGRFEFPHFDPKRPLAMTPKIEASMALSRIYEQGIGVPVDHKEARYWYEKAGEAGYMAAYDILGRTLLSGDWGEPDPGKGTAFLKKAGEAGYLPAAFHLGQAYHDGVGVPRDYKQAGAWFDAASRAGLPAATYAAGRMFELGEGVPADQAKALVYYKEAALKGDRDAQFAMSTYFYTGDVVGRKDAVIARKWFQAAALQAQPDAMYNMGAMLMAGEGGAQDQALAYVWFNLAKKAGYTQAEDALRALGPRLSPAEMGRADSILNPVAAR